MDVVVATTSGDGCAVNINWAVRSEPRSWGSDTFGGRFVNCRSNKWTYMDPHSKDWEKINWTYENLGFWILNFKFWNLNLEFWIELSTSNFEFQIWISFKLLSTMYLLYWICIVITLPIGYSLLEIRLMKYVKLVIYIWVGEGNGRGCTLFKVGNLEKWPRNIFFEKIANFIRPWLKHLKHQIMQHQVINLIYSSRLIDRTLNFA